MDSTKKRINLIAIGTGLFNLLMATLLFCGQLFESPENAIHRLAGSGSQLILGMFVGVISGGASIVHIFLALALRRKTDANSRSITVLNYIFVIFSVGLLILTISIISAVAS